MARTFFNRYIWLVDTIRRAKYITLKELSEKWQRSSLNENGAPLPERTFFNHCKEISEQLYISSNTVEYHRKQLLRKTASRNAAELIGNAFRMRLLNLDD